RRPASRRSPLPLPDCGRGRAPRGARSPGAVRRIGKRGVLRPAAARRGGAVDRGILRVRRAAAPQRCLPDSGSFENPRDHGRGPADSARCGGRSAGAGGARRRGPGHRTGERGASGRRDPRPGRRPRTLPATRRKRPEICRARIPAGKTGGAIFAALGQVGALRGRGIPFRPAVVQSNSFDRGAGMRTYILILLSSSALSYLLTFWIARLASERGWAQREGDGSTGGGTPRLGGLAVFAAILLSFGAALLLHNMVTERLLAV